MKKTLSIASLIFLSVTMLGCSKVPPKYQFVRNNSNDYLHAQATQPLQIPAGYSSDRLQAHYVVPNPQLANQGQPPKLYPPDVTRDQSLI